MLELIQFHKQKKRFAIDSNRIEGLEEDEFGAILVCVFYLNGKSEIQRIHVDESFEEAFNKINGIDPWDDTYIPVDGE